MGQLARDVWHHDPTVRALFMRRSGDGRCADCRIRGWSMCAGLSLRHHDRLEALREDRRHNAGETLFSEGEEAGHVFSLTEGVARLVKSLPDGRRQIVGFLFPGDLLGLALGQSYSCDAEALTATRSCRFARAPLDKLRADFPELESQLLRIAQAELMAAQEQMLILGRKTAPEKLASFLMMIDGRQNRLGAAAHEPNHLNAPMTRAEIGDFLGLTLETVSRVFSRFVREGLIALPHPKSVILLNRDRLAHIAAGLG